MSCLEGKDVLSIADRENPDLIFLSTNLTENNGLECLNSIKSRNTLKDVPVIMVSTLGCDENAERYRFAESDEIIHKPISRHLFRKTVSKFLDLEKRHNARLALRFPVAYGVTSDSCVIGYSMNLGVGGLFVESRKVVPIDTELVVDFLLPETEVRIRCKARVAWVNCANALVKPYFPQGLGLQFLDLKQEDATAIKEFLKNEFLSRMM